MSFEREPLPNPPLVEALFDLRAACEVPYILVPGALMRRLQGFSTLEEADNAVFGPVKLSAQAFHRFRSDDDKRLVQVGPGLFTVNVLGDYGEFEVFQELVQRALEAFVRAARPSKVIRIGIRYINLIREDLLSELDEPIRVSWRFPAEVFTPTRGLNMRALFDFPEHGGTLSFAVSRPHTLPDGRRGCLLDYDFFKSEPTFPLSECLSWTARGHDLIYQAFRATLSPALHERLKKDVPHAT